MTRSSDRLGRSDPRGRAAAEVEPPTEETVAIPGKSGNGAPASVEGPNSVIPSETFEIIEWGELCDELPPVVSDRDLAKKYRPCIHAFHNELLTGRHDKKLERYVRQVRNHIAGMLLDCERSRGNLLQDVEFRYSPYSARVDSEMEEGEYHQEVG